MWRRPRGAGPRSRRRPGAAPRAGRADRGCPRASAPGVARGRSCRGHRSKRRLRRGAAPDRATGGRPRRWPGRAGRPGSRRAAPGASDRGPHDRAVGLVDAGWPGGSPKHGHRLAQGADPGDRLVEQARHPDPGRPVDQDGPRPAVRGIIEGRSEIGERLFATHEPGARIPDRHAGIIRAASARLDPDDGPPALAPPRQHAQRAAR